MRKKNNSWLWGAAFLGVLGLSGCKEPFDAKVMKILQAKKGYTEEQALVGAGQALRWRYMVEKDGLFLFNYNAVPLEDKVKKIRGMQRTLNFWLDPRNDRTRRYLDLFKQREYLEHQEKILEYKVDRFNHVILYAQFERLMRKQHVSFSPVMKEAPTPKGLSDLEILLPQTNLTKELPFNAGYVESAKSRKQLRELENIIHSITFYEEEANPQYPHIDPHNKTRLVRQTRDLQIITYSCSDVGNEEEVRTRSADYIEVFRSKNGAWEETPAIKIFKSQGSELPTVVVLDKDRAGLRGHGVPDLVSELEGGLMSGKMLLTHHEGLLEALFTKPVQEKRVLPVEVPQEVKIVHVGEAVASKYVLSEDGWKVPYDRYNQGTNYTLWVKYVDDKTPHAVSPELALRKVSEIEYVAKRFFVPGTRDVLQGRLGDDVQGRVVEYYKVKPEFAKSVKAAYIDEGTHMLKLLQHGKPLSENSDEFFFVAQDGKDPKPYMIQFDEGERRFSIVDIDGKPQKKSLYEAREEFARPHDLDLRQDGVVR